MEGVVLYFIIVQVFISHQKHYIAFFTIASFGVRLPIDESEFCVIILVYIIIM